MLRTIVAITVALSGPVLAADPPARVALYTIGPGDKAFARFGHAAICVFDAPSPRGRCYNYGTADFSTPAPMTWDMLRARAIYWLSVIDHDDMVRKYQRNDRTIFRQFLPLDSDQTLKMVRRLAADAMPDNKTYIYHHFRDNCSTRPRDLIDLIFPGQLRPVSDREAGDKYRQFVRQGLADDWRALAMSELVLGRALDTSRTRWEAMFLPRILRQEVQKHLGSVPEVIYLRQAPAPGGDPLGGVRALLLLALAIGLPGCAAVWWGGRRTRFLGLLLPAIVVSLAGLAVVIGPLISTQPELRFNELPLILLPTDLGLALLAGRGLRLGLALRTAMVLSALALSLAGWFVQPILGPLFLVGAMLVPGWLTVLRTSRDQ